MTKEQQSSIVNQLTEEMPGLSGESTKLSREVSSKSSPFTALVGNAFGDLEEVFTAIKTDSATTGLGLIKVHGQIVRMARGIEMRMVDTQKMSPSDAVAMHPFSQAALDEVVKILESDDRIDDSEGLIEAIRELKASAAKEVERQYLNFESGKGDRSNLVLAVLSESFVSAILAAAEIEAWAIDTRHAVKAEIQKFAKQFGIGDA